MSLFLQDSRLVEADPGIQQTIAEIYATTGDIVSIAKKRKSLTKFGRTLNADNGVRTTVAEFQDAVVNETFVSTNIIDSAVSTSGSDTGVITVEGHTIDGSGNLTFVVQDVTLLGQSEATLTTPLARATRAYVKNGTFASPASTLVGDVAIYDNTGVTLSAGKADVDAAVKLMIRGTLGYNQSQKSATSISSQDYFIITAVNFGITSGSPSGVAAEFDLEYRDVANGGVWRPMGLEVGLTLPGQSFARLSLDVPRWIGKNSDIRSIAVADTNDTQVNARFSGYLASVLT